ncbi:MAG: type II toxin-antitoxin system Phd/YefM family antitoxin [Longimicrobiaceae bacterium]|jgi:antitoxin YefM
MKTVSYSYARAHLGEIWDEVESSREEVLLRRRGHQELALLPARELRSLRETVHLLRSPRNAERLFLALAASDADDGDKAAVFVSTEQLAAAIGLRR